MTVLKTVFSMAIVLSDVHGAQCTHANDCEALKPHASKHDEHIEWPIHGESDG